TKNENLPSPCGRGVGGEGLFSEARYFRKPDEYGSYTILGSSKSEGAVERRMSGASGYGVMLCSKCKKFCGSYLFLTNKSELYASPQYAQRKFGKSRSG